MVRSNLTVVMGAKGTASFLSKSVFSISIGSNDIFGHFATNSTVPKEQFISVLMTAYESYIKVLILRTLPQSHRSFYLRFETDILLVQSLYSLGARKFGIISVPPVGCCPSRRIFNSTGGCLEIQNDFSRSFHSELSVLMSRISSELPAIKYSIANTFEMTMNVIENHLLFGKKIIS